MLAGAGARQADGGCLWGTAETGFWDPATGEANSSVRPFSACGPGHHSIPVGSSAGGRGSPPGTFKEMDRERCPCILVTHPNPLWFSLAAVGAWASTSWATCAWPLSLCLGLEQQSLHRLVQHMEVLDGCVCHAQVRPNAQGQQQVKDGWLDPVSVHHLLQLVIEDKLRVPLVGLHVVLPHVLQVAAQEVLQCTQERPVLVQQLGGPGLVGEPVHD